MPPKQAAAPKGDPPGFITTIEGMVSYYAISHILQESVLICMVSKPRDLCLCYRPQMHARIPTCENRADYTILFHVCPQIND